MRLFLSPLALFSLAMGCAAEPGVLPREQSSEPSETATFSTDDTESTSDTTQQETVSSTSTSEWPTQTSTETSSGSDTGSESSTASFTNTQSQTDDTGSVSDTASITDSSSDLPTEDTQPQTADSSTSTGSESASHTDSDTSDTDSYQPQSPCELMAERVDGLVCCPQVLPGDCTDDSWSFTGSGSSVGCCTEDLDSRLYCAKTALVEEACKHTCGPQQYSLGCVENSCNNPYPITDYPLTVADSFLNYKNTFEPSDNSCGNGGGGEDVWFLLVLPPRSSVTAQEVTDANVTWRLVSGCSVKRCLIYAEEPEVITFKNSSNAPLTIILVLSEASPSWTANFKLEFRSQPL